MRTSAADAYVNDNRREIWGADAIRKLMENEFVNFKVTMEVQGIVDHYGDIIVAMVSHECPCISTDASAEPPMTPAVLLAPTLRCGRATSQVAG
jgi:hypothetical protein